MGQNETLGLADLTKEFYKLYKLTIAWTSNCKYWCLKLRQEKQDNIQVTHDSYSISQKRSPDLTL